MKIPKEARKLSRSLFRSAMVNGRLDAARVAALVADVANTRPRHYLSALQNLQRLVRMELARRHAVIESAVALDAATSARIVTDLKARYGADITTEFATNPDLIGGTRIRLGSDVWDGSVRGRLNALKQDLAHA